MKRITIRGLIAVLLAILMVIQPFKMYEANATEAAMTPVQAHGQLRVSGTQIVDQNGNAFQLRGISTHGINWDVGKPYVNQAAFQTLRDDWGANAVRLAMYTAEYNGYCSGGNQADLKNTLYNGVEYAKNLGMYAIIDWHILNDNNPNQNIEQAKVFFNEVSAKYKNYNNVLYEICNEPNNCTWDEIKSYANTIIPIIRANDPDAIIIVGTPTWSQLGQWGHTNEVADSPLTGYSNIVYTLHFYCNEGSHTQYLPAKVDYAVSKGLPILVSEFGLSSANGNGGINTAQAQAWLDKLDSYKIGYFCWSLSNKAESSALLSSSCTKTSGWTESDLSDAGRWIRSQYQARKEVYVVVDKEAVQEFVTRLYRTCLGREPETQGLEAWTRVLCNGQSNGADSGYGFVFSDEYQNKNTSDEQYVEMLYEVFLNRNADEAGKQGWLGVLQQGVSREHVFKGFVESAEYTNLCASYGIARGSFTPSQPRDQNAGVTGFVSRLYTKALGRNYEVDGLNAWCNQINSGANSPEYVAECFINSDEFIRKNLSNEEYVKVLYRTFLGREYDEPGLKAWVNQLNNGVSRQEVLHGFSRSAEFARIMAQYGL